MTQDILDKLQPFSVRQLSDAASIIKVIRKRGISDEAFLGAVESSVEAKKIQVRTDAASTATRPAAPPVNRKLKQKPKPGKPARQYPEILSCPKCGQTAYAQPVCPGCAKGKAGIRREYICGECNFVFYLD